MPINATIGSTITFIVEFLDANGLLTVPSSATLTVVYPVGATVSSCTIGMVPNGSFFTATWGSGVSDLGIVNYSVTAPALPAVVGEQLRITT